MTFNELKTAGAICLVLSGSITTTPVFAQVLEELVVTAQRRSESVQDIPVAISGLNADQIEELGFGDATELTAQVPNVQVSGTFGKTQPIFSIRGISQSDFSSNQASPVGVYIDEAYMGATFTHGLNFFDLERTEVLRGPQGTLYGRNTTGGAINLITRTPEIGGETTGDIRVGVGNFGLFAANGAIETTLVEDKLALRVAFITEEDNGYFRNLLGGPNLAQTDFFGARVALNFQATERLNAVLKLTTGDSSPRGIPGRFEGRIPAGPGLFVDAVGASRDPSLSNFEGEIDEQGNFDSDSDLATLRLTYDADNFSLVSVTSYNDAEFLNEADTDGHAGFRNASQVYSGQSKGFNQDVRFVSDFSGPVNFIAGLYFGEEGNDAQVRTRLVNPDFNIFLLSPNPADQELGALFTQLGGTFQELESTKKAFAVYGQARWQISEALGLDIGLRYTSDQISRDRLSNQRVASDGITSIGSFIPGNILGINAPFLPPGALGPGSAGLFLDGPLTDASAPNFTETEREVTGKLGVDYKFNEDILVYASYNRGFRGGSINNGGQFAAPPTLDGIYATPEFVDAYELGIKSDFFDGKLRVNGAAFFYDYTDQQFVNQVGLAAFIENAGGSEIKGVELEIFALLTANLSVNLGLGYLDTEFTELTLANTATPDPFDEVDLAGNELISAPKLNFSIAADYNLPLRWGEFNVHVDANFQDDQFYSALK